jgi:tetratricopeptide (TPR) repeat protein
MPEIRLKEAVDLVFQIVDQRHRRKRPSPFFFVAGAGISAPPLKLAREIEDECRDVAKRYGKTAGPPSDAASDSYSHWLSTAYPSPEELQNYLRDLMENKPISKANLRLAHLLIDRRIATTVFTPNFDDLLSRALSLFGESPLVCDHPLTATRMTVQDQDLQIIHVHGSYWFYDCVNRTADIARRARDAAMSALLDRWLHEHSPLVVGYSGWDDIFMSALKSRIEANALGTPLFWFCYKRDSLAALPAWLTQSHQGNNIYFVLPEDPAPSATASTSASSAPAVIRSTPSASTPQSSSRSAPTSSPSASPTPTATLSTPKETTLPAIRVFDALIQRFEPPSPPLKESPLEFFAKRLREQLGVREQDDPEPDLYSFNKVISRIDRAAILLDQDEKKAKPDLLQPLRDAISRADYRGVVASASSINFNTLSPVDLKQAFSILFESSMALNDEPEEEIAAYTLVVSVGDRIAADSAVQEQVAKALAKMGYKLAGLGRYEEAIAACDEVIRRFGTSSHLVFCEQVAKALVSKSYCLGNLGRLLESIDACDEVLERFADSPDAVFKPPVAKALINKGYTLQELNRDEEAIVIYDEVVRRFGDSTELDLREQVGGALVNKSTALGKLGRFVESIAVYDEMVLRFADSPEPVFRDQVARTLISKANSLQYLGRVDEELAAYDEVIRRFGDATEPELREQVGVALINKGVTLLGLGKYDEEIALLDDVLRRLGDSAEPALQNLVAVALINKGTAFGALGKTEEEIASFNDLIRRFADSSDVVLQEDVAIALINKASAHSRSGDTEAEIKAYDEIIRRFAQSSEPSIENQLAAALVLKGFALAKIGKTQEAVAAFDSVVTRFSQSTDPNLEEQLARALLYRGTTLEQAGKKDAALSDFRALLTRFASNQEPAIVSLVEPARAKIQELSGERL